MSRIALALTSALFALSVLIPSTMARPLDETGTSSAVSFVPISATDSYVRASLDACAAPVDAVEAIVLYGEAAAGFFGFTAPDPCCACGIQPSEGCVAFAKPCCCRAKFGSNGVLECYCEGGKGCGTSSTRE